MGPIGSSQTSVRNYHYLLRNNPEDCSSRLQMHVCTVFSTSKLTSVVLKYLRHVDLISFHQKQLVNCSLFL